MMSPRHSTSLRVALLPVAICWAMTCHAPLHAEGGPQASLRSRTKVQVKQPVSEETLTRLIKFRSRVKNLQMDWRNENGAEIMRSFSGEIGGGRLAATSYINWTRPEVTHTAHAQLSNVDMRDLLHASDVQMDGRCVARLSGVLDFRWQGLRMRAIRSSLEGKAVLTTGQGYVAASEILDSVARISGIPDLRRFDFTEGRFEADVRSGQFHISHFHLNGPLARLTAEGTVDLDTQNMDMRISVSVAESLAGRSSSDTVRAALMLLGRVKSLRESGGFVRIPVVARVGGTLAKPQVSFDSVTEF
jgi:hypothetical protein